MTLSPRLGTGFRSKFSRPVSSDGVQGTRLKKYNDRLSAQFTDIRQHGVPFMGSTSSDSNSSSDMTGTYSELNTPVLQQNEARQTAKDQTCWKYHVTKVSSNEFYLTTNPDSKHLYCRNAPGYWCTLLLPSAKPKRGQSQRDVGFRLVLVPRLESGLESKDVIIVTKTTAGFEVAFTSLLVLDRLGNLRHDVNEKLKEKVDAAEIKMNTSETLSDDSSNDTLKLALGTMHRYETDSVDKFGSFVVGPTPRVKQKTLNKLGLTNKIYKLADKGIVYFTSKEFAIPKQRHRSSEIQPELDVDSVVALFRPCDRQFKKLVAKKLRMKESYMDTDGYDDDVESLSSTDTSLSSTSQHYKTGDGMILKDPNDDSPNDDKVGWVTIYDDPRLFGPTEDGNGTGMWELVLGLTFAVGFERILDKYLEKEASI
ncbi:unnamed protein product [Kuraishia capsulata CBS 1993]|uniref:Uncharacterized protein n=1 Tax=Kuraishia capsulata CBS 1993 TaxID=1382522 RepID=W6MRP6_9ASCO|nr:uncharacterized protein KUCA_T00003902001 [Kuraishia capsulata CBS 1993]CDK27922.1 unnamed protein product [Kuraishia capsulata CBS 1993]